MVPYRAGDGAPEKDGVIVSRVLVVDDARVARAVLREALQAAGHEVVEAAGAADGLKAAVETRPDCITTDLLMPGLDGLAFLDSLRARGVSAPVIVVTADIQKSTREECLRRGVSGGARQAGQRRRSRARGRRARWPAGRARSPGSISEAQVDAIQEAINIGVGRAAAALNDLVDRPVSLVAPSVELLSFEAARHAPSTRSAPPTCPRCRWASTAGSRAARS